MYQIIRVNFNQIGINLKNVTMPHIPQKLLESGMSDILRTLIILLIMYLTIKIGSNIITKFVERQKKLRYSIDIKKANTLGAVLKSILRYSVYFFGIITILTQFMGKISLTFAGIGTVAIGFGAQSLIKDIINGFFILFEDQFAVGDYIEVEGKGGVVESLELRVSKIRDLNGDLHIIPNGLITKVTNHSRGSLALSVAIDFPYDQDMDRVIEIIENVCEKFKIDNLTIVEGPEVVGITAFKQDFYTIKISGKAKPMTHWGNENKLRMELKRALDKEKIKMAYSQIQIKKEDENAVRF